MTEDGEEYVPRKFPITPENAIGIMEQFFAIHHILEGQDYDQDVVEDDLASMVLEVPVFLHYFHNEGPRHEMAKALLQYSRRMWMAAVAISSEVEAREISGK